MVTRNIYVSDGDVQLFDKAAQIAGSMSAAVSAGLRLYVAQQEVASEKAKMREIQVEVQDGALVRTKIFVGRELLRYKIRGDGRTITYRVYVTLKEQLAVVIRNDPDWAVFSSADDDAPIWKDPSTWNSSWWETTERSLSVYSGIEEMTHQLPDELIAAVDAALSENTPTILDI